jgi:glycosyltransferase involved in cell wall biosynthesis
MQDVEVTGEVADVAPFLLEGEIAIVPLRFGGGSRLKILEAFSSGIPVVSTTMGAEGLSVQDGVHIMLADSPGEFADKILQLSGDADLRRALAKAGRVLVEERYDWGMLAKKQGEVWREVVHESAGPSEADPPVSGAR